MFPGTKTPVIGLTGPTGAGKSTAARALQNLGCGVIDGDALTREITMPGSPVLRQLQAAFGTDICKGETLDRKRLAARAFKSEETRKHLNAITHPAITRLALARAKTLQSHRAIIVDAAALLDSELAGLCDTIWVIAAPEDTRLTRVLARDNLLADEARTRMAAQRRMDYDGHTIIMNDGSEAALREKIAVFFADFLGGFGGIGSTAPNP
ncbi:MAG: dephospho-CoA kinase [Oscillospiraceae bacterium]|jgi:dephospho-CoA kinase|nr:dephospho-CoA kinase [Oscillospiraceae bacterium]